MKKNEKKPSEDTIRSNYKKYEKQASMTFEQIRRKKSRTIGIYLFCFIEIAALILLILKLPVWAAIICVIGIASGIAVSRILYGRYNNNYENYSLIASSGYTQEFFDKLRKLPDDKTKSLSIAAAMAYVFCGDLRSAFSELQRVDASLYIHEPEGAQLYYPTLMTAYLLSGDLDRAADTYSKGSYFMRTYMNSPIYGSYISLCLAIYEFYSGRRSASLQLLDNAVLIGDKKFRSESPEHREIERISNENMSAVIQYWKAMIFEADGKKSAAYDSLSIGRKLYKTPYYERLYKELTVKIETEPQIPEEQTDETLS